MFPKIFQIGSFALHSYGLMMMIAFIFGLWLTRKRAKARDLKPDLVSDYAFWLILFSLLGARGYYAIIYWDEFAHNPFNIINPFQGETIGIAGLVVMGGIIAGTITTVVYFLRKKAPLMKYMDAIAPAVGFGIFFGRIGCFLNGCCWGKGVEASCPVGVSFPVDNPLAGHYQHSHGFAELLPSQLMLAGGGLIIGLLILWLGKKRLFDGFEILLLGLLYAVDRFAVDFSRYYYEEEIHKVFGIDFTHNQLILIIVFLSCLTAIIVKYKKAKKLKN